MNLATALPAPHPFRDELIVRLNLGMLMLLAHLLTNATVVPAIKNGVVILVLYCLIEICLIAITAKVCGDRNIAKDTNLMNFCALVVHVVAIAAYLAKISSDYHNNTIIALTVMYIARLMYFGRWVDGDYVSLPFKTLSKLQTFLLNKFNRHLPAMLFFGSAIPMWAIVWRTNDSAIAIAIVCLMVYIFFISTKIENAKHAPLSIDDAFRARINAAILNLHGESLDVVMTVVESTVCSAQDENISVDEHLNVIARAERKQHVEMTWAQRVMVSMALVSREFLPDSLKQCPSVFLYVSLDEKQHEAIAKWLSGSGLK